MYLKLFQNIESSYPTIVRMDGNEYTIILKEHYHLNTKYNFKQIILCLWF